MKLLVGLGNPTEEYVHTRHNVGFLFVDHIAKDLGLDWQEDKYTASLIAKNTNLVLAKPQTYMNNSGQAVKKLVDFFNIQPQNLIIIHDDLDIRLNEYKIQNNGPKDHGGINDIENHLKTSDFLRVRIGIDNREIENRIPGEEYVLQNFNKQELDLIKEVVLHSSKNLLENYVK